MTTISCFLAKKFQSSNTLNRVCFEKLKVISKKLRIHAKVQSLGTDAVYTINYAFKNIPYLLKRVSSTKSIECMHLFYCHGVRHLEQSQIYGRKVFNTPLFCSECSEISVTFFFTKK